MTGIDFAEGRSYQYSASTRSPAFPAPESKKKSRFTRVNAFDTGVGPQHRNKPRISAPPPGPAAAQTIRPFAARGRVSDPFPLASRRVDIQHRSLLAMPQNVDSGDSSTSSSERSDEDSELSDGEMFGGSTQLRGIQAPAHPFEDRHDQNEQDANVAAQMRALKEGPLIKGAFEQCQQVQAAYEIAARNAKFLFVDVCGHDYAKLTQQNFGNMTSQAQRIAHELRQQHTETCAAMNAASGRAEELNLRLQSLAKQLSQDRLEFEEDLASLRHSTNAKLSDLKESFEQSSAKLKQPAVGRATPKSAGRKGKR